MPGGIRWLHTQPTSFYRFIKKHEILMNLWKKGGCPYPLRGLAEITYENYCLGFCLM